jgi:K+-sensing histidine kinase KdpD
MVRVGAGASQLSLVEEGFIVSVLASCATTLAAFELLRFFSTSNVVMLFLFAVVLLALRYGRLIGAWSAALFVASFDFFFVEPRFSFAVSDTQYLFTFALILLVALITGELGVRLREKARAAAAAQLRVEGERLRNALLAAVSHDLKTPLTAIGGLAQTLEHADGMSPGEQREVLCAIRLQTEGMHRLVTNLLDLARMQSEGVQLNKEWHALDEIVGSALSQLGSALAGHRVRTALPADLPLIDVDALAVERVLVNLVDNAVKYTPPGSTISIGARVDGVAVEIVVEDDGPGLPRLDTGSLFDPFTRGAKESSIRGVGLGLALCRSIVGAHAGTIEARHRDTPGACFAIRLPRGTPPALQQECLA